MYVLLNVQYYFIYLFLNYFCESLKRCYVTSILIYLNVLFMFENLTGNAPVVSALACCSMQQQEQPAWWPSQRKTVEKRGAKTREEDSPLPASAHACGHRPRTGRTDSRTANHWKHGGGNNKLLGALASTNQRQEASGGASPMQVTSDISLCWCVCAEPMPGMCYCIYFVLVSH